MQRVHDSPHRSDTDLVISRKFKLMERHTLALCVAVLISGECKIKKKIHETKNDHWRII